MPIKITPDVRKRFKVAAAEEGLTYCQLLEQWLDARDSKLERQRRAQAHPFHRPTEVTHL